MCKWQGFLGAGLPGHWALTLIVHPTHFPGLFSKRAGNRRWESHTLQNDSIPAHTNTGPW